MDKITIYHGSSDIITKPVYGFGNPNNDYGIGFYCTEDIELAKEWSCSSDKNGYTNEYTFEVTDMTVLSLTEGNYNILNWLYVLLENRQFASIGQIATIAKEYIFKNFAIDYKNYDIIKGYRADDSYFSFASAFLNNTISISQLGKAMSLGKLGEQVVVMSEKGCNALEFVDAHKASKDIYYPKKVSRDTFAREQFKKEKNREAILTDKYIIDIIREGWVNNDERLQRVILG